MSYRQQVGHCLWDPIGISEYPSARDEYHSYLTAIYQNVKSEDLESLVEYMKWVVGNMGLNFNKEDAYKAARVMLEWKRHIDDLH